jgi:hypothetical protein
VDGRVAEERRGPTSRSVPHPRYAVTATGSQLSADDLIAIAEVVKADLAKTA